MNVQVSNKINPVKPTGLEPAPKTSDNDPLVNKQLKKPLIPENRTSNDDLMNAQKNKPESKTSAPVVTKPVQTTKAPAPVAAKAPTQAAAKAPTPAAAKAPTPVAAKAPTLTAAKAPTP